MLDVKLPQASLPAQVLRHNMTEEDRIGTQVAMI